MDEFLGALLVGLLLLPVKAWALMILLGMLAGYMAIPGLAIGFWACLGVVELIGLVRMKVGSDTN